MQNVPGWLQVLLPILTVVVGALVGLFQFHHAHRAQRQAQARAWIIEAQRPFLERQTELYFETAQVVGKLVTIDPASVEWTDTERRYWALYWSELSVVEHRAVELAMIAFGEELKRYAKAPPEATLEALQGRSYDLAHAIRRSMQSAWLDGVALSPQQNASVD